MGARNSVCDIAPETLEAIKTWIKYWDVKKRRNKITTNVAHDEKHLLVKFLIDLDEFDCENIKLKIIQMDE